MKISRRILFIFPVLGMIQYFSHLGANRDNLRENQDKILWPISETEIFEHKVRRELAGVNFNGINKEWILSIALLETGNGKGYIYNQTNNLFSITTNANHGESFFMAKGQFHKKYFSDNESILEFRNLLLAYSRYRITLQQAHLDNRKGFFRALQNAGYAGKDKHYAEKLERIYQELVWRKSLKRITKRKSMDVDSFSISYSESLPYRNSMGRFSNEFNRSKRIF